MKNQDFYAIAKDVAKDFNLNIDTSHGCYLYKNTNYRVYISNLKIQNNKNDTIINFIWQVKERTINDTWNTICTRPVTTNGIYVTAFRTIKKGINDFIAEGYLLDTEISTRNEIINIIKECAKNRNIQYYRGRNLQIRNNEFYRIYVKNIEKKEDIVFITWLLQEATSWNKWKTINTYQTRCPSNLLKRKIMETLSMFEKAGYFNKSSNNIDKNTKYTEMYNDFSSIDKNRKYTEIYNDFSSIDKNTKYTEIYNNLSIIAKKYLNVETLQVQDIDTKNYYKIHVKDILIALIEAYRLGQETQK